MFVSFREGHIFQAPMGSHPSKRGLVEGAPKVSLWAFEGGGSRMGGFGGKKTKVEWKHTMKHQEVSLFLGILPSFF